MSAGTANEIVEDALRLLTVLDAEESATASQMSRGVRVLNQLMQHEFGDALSSFQTERVDYTVPAKTSEVTISPNGNIKFDAREVHNIYYGKFGATRYELKRKSETHIFAVGIDGPNPVNFMAEMVLDGSLKVTLWPRPSQATPLAFTLGLRVAKIANGTDPVLVPPDAAYFLGYILASRLRSEYGIPLLDVQDVVSLAKQKEAEWKAFSTKNKSIRLRRKR